MPRAMVARSDVAICCPVTRAYRRSSVRSTGWFLARALRGLLEASGLERGEIDGLIVSSFGVRPDNVIFLTEHFGLSPRIVDEIPYGGVAGVMALRRAVRAVEAGDAEVVACIAGDALGGAAFHGLISGFSGDSRDTVYPHGGAGPNAVFAMMTADYMAETGATAEDFGAMVTAFRRNALGNPVALQKRPLDVQGYLAARMIADPLRLYDCVMPCCGAEAFLVTTVDRARREGLDFAVTLGSIERHNAYPGEIPQRRFGWSVDVEALYEEAGVGPEEMDFAQLYDDYPVMVMRQLEELRLAPEGDAIRQVRKSSLAVGEGGLPVNTGGGQLGVGQAGAAAGYLFVVETLRQLFDQGGARQVAGARHGLVSGFGMVNNLRGLSTAAAVLMRGNTP